MIIYNILLLFPKKPYKLLSSKEKTTQYGQKGSLASATYPPSFWTLLVRIMAQQPVIKCFYWPVYFIEIYWPELKVRNVTCDMWRFCLFPVLWSRAHEIWSPTRLSYRKEFLKLTTTKNAEITSYMRVKAYAILVCHFNLFHMKIALNLFPCRGTSPWSFAKLSIYVLQRQRCFYTHNNVVFL